uniref:hypothetical protein n=1 Tax=Corynebacterium stationis TaxID=1705 RepID=UPI00261E9842
MMLSAATLFGCSTSDDSTDVTVEPTPISETTSASDFTVEPTPISETTSASDFTEAQLKEILQVSQYFDEEEEYRRNETPNELRSISTIEFRKINNDIKVVAKFRNVPWEVTISLENHTFDVGGTLNPETGEITWDDNDPYGHNSGAERQQVTE